MRTIQSFRSITGPLIFIGGPTLLAAVYYIFLAQPVFRTEIKFLPLPQQEAANLGAGEVLEAYLYSPGLFSAIDEQLNLRKHYSQAAKDPLNFFPANASDDALRFYFQEKVNLRRSAESNLLTLSVAAFSSQFAESLTDLLYLSLKEEWLRLHNAQMTEKMEPVAMDEGAASASHSLFVVSGAHSPDLPSFPSPFRGILTVFVIALLLYGVGRLVLATVHDHNV